MQYQIQNDTDGNPCAVTIVGKLITIPMNPDNIDYQAYLKWVAEGNEPLPAEEA